MNVHSHYTLLGSTASIPARPGAQSGGILRLMKDVLWDEVSV
jgi:hypothetical protein